MQNFLPVTDAYASVRVCVETRARKTHVPPTEAVSNKLPQLRLLEHESETTTAAPLEKTNHHSDPQQAHTGACPQNSSSIKQAPATAAAGA